MWWVLFILFILISIFTSVTLYYALKRISQYEQLHDEYRNIVNQVRQIVTFSNEKIKKIDMNGTFESDDEVGFFFNELKNIQNVLDEIFIIEDNQKDNQENKDAKKEK